MPSASLPGDGPIGRRGFAAGNGLRKAISMKRIRNFIQKMPLFSSVLFSLFLGFWGALFALLAGLLEGVSSPTEWLAYSLEGLLAIPLVSFLLGAFVVYPLVLTAVNLVLLFAPAKYPPLRRAAKGFEVVTLVLGSLYSVLIQALLEICWLDDWQETLYNSQVHTPIYTQAWPTVLTFLLAGLAGYLALSFIRLEKLPPLAAVLAISAMYLGTAEMIAFAVQVFSTQYLILCLFPFNCVLITAKTIRYKIWEWNRLSEAQKRTWRNPLLNALNQRLKNALCWPFAAFLLMGPLFGILVGILLLFGQQPDTWIRAFTETSDWNLSQRTAPQNVYYDEHYLCTVAAGGHPKLVKPLRMGERHGHRVVVNRQLCIANAFEQILEERTPRLHRRIRHLYDTCGFPLARKIRSRRAADAVYLLMKPLEWFFLAVLYLCDAKPENRIAVQYLPRAAVETAQKGSFAAAQSGRTSRT